MKQLFANNAKTTLASPITASSTSVVVQDGSQFPSPGAYEYFLLTLEVGSSVEIVMIIARTGNTMTIGGLTYSGETVPGRGQEGTGAKDFATGARAECRVTSETLNRRSTSLAEISSVNSVAAPRDSYQEGYVASTFDPYGNPVIAVAKDDTTWKFPNYTQVASGTATAASTTTVTTSSISLQGIESGKFIIQFTSGTYAGQIRVVTDCTANVVTWSGALIGSPSVGDTFEVLESNACLLRELIASADDSIIMALILGGD